MALRQRLRFVAWRLRTRAALLSARRRAMWRSRFLAAPELHNARNWAQLPDLALAAFETMAGFYNDHVAGGYMTAFEAERIYRGK